MVMHSAKPDEFAPIDDAEMIRTMKAIMKKHERTWADIKSQLTGKPAPDKTLIEQARLDSGCTWFDLQGPSRHLMRRVLSLLKVHPLTMEDIVSGDVTREKVRTYRRDDRSVRSAALFTAAALDWIGRRGHPVPLFFSTSL